MLSPSRFKQLHAGMNSAAKKVYEAVPIAELWSVEQTTSEMARRNIVLDKRVVHGCLAGLRDAGLVKEGPVGHFKRVPVREKAASAIANIIQEESTVPQAATIAKIEPKPQTDPQPKKSPIDRLGDLSERVVKMAHELRSLADDISDTALEMAASMEANEASVAQLRQLQALLKQIGMAQPTS
jgi:hypothetical protein